MPAKYEAAITPLLRIIGGAPGELTYVLTVITKCWLDSLAPVGYTEMALAVGVLETAKHELMRDASIHTRPAKPQPTGMCLRRSHRSLRDDLYRPFRRAYAAAEGITADEVMAVYTLGAPVRTKHRRLRRRRSGVEPLRNP